MVASAQRVAFAVDVPVSHMSTGRAIKRVSRQRNLSAPDTPTVVWLYRADRFDGGQIRRRGSIFCLLSGSVNSLRGNYPSGCLDTELHQFPVVFLYNYLHICSCIRNQQIMCKYTATNLEPEIYLFFFLCLLVWSHRYRKIIWVTAREGSPQLSEQTISLLISQQVNTWQQLATSIVGSLFFHLLFLLLCVK